MSYTAPLGVAAGIVPALPTLADQLDPGEPASIWRRSIKFPACCAEVRTLFMPAPPVGAGVAGSAAGAGLAVGTGAVTPIMTVFVTSTPA